MKWWKEDGELPTDRLSRDNFGKTLLINSVVTVDQGTYVCAADGEQHKMTVEVTAAPFWVTGPPADVNAAEESKAELRCEATGEPRPLVRWYMNGKPLDGNTLPSLIR